MRQRVAVIPGDGIGIEVVAEATRMLEALGDPRVPDNRHARDILLGTRFELDLYVNYRPVRLLDDRLCPLKNRTRADVDFVVFRENTEGAYVGAGGRLRADTDDEIAIQQEVNTYRGVHRIVRYAFEFAKARGLRKVCMADKSNAMTHGHALWQRVFRELARAYPEIEATHLYIDALAMLLVHGSAPPLAGKNVANPIGAILSAALMLETLGRADDARRIERAVEAAVHAGETTRDIGGSLGTKEAGAAILRRLR